MGAFVIVYLVVWLAVSIYVLRMAVRQRRLEEDLEALRSQLARPAEHSIVEGPTSKAA